MEDWRLVYIRRINHLDKEELLKELKFLLDYRDCIEEFNIKLSFVIRKLYSLGD